jgi:DNA-binding XRE family transcriptional regulator
LTRQFDMVFDAEAYRRRIRILRKIFDMNQTQFAQYIGVPFKKWNHYERGYPIPRETAFILREKIPDISIDWLWFGSTGGVSSAMLRQIRSLQKDEARRGPPRPGEQEHLRLVVPVKRRIARGNR